MSEIVTDELSPTKLKTEMIMKFISMLDLTPKINDTITLLVII